MVNVKYIVFVLESVLIIFGNYVIVYIKDMLVILFF